MTKLANEQLVPWNEIEPLRAEGNSETLQKLIAKLARELGT